MTETAVGIMPDVFTAISPEIGESHATEVTMSLSGKEQRRAHFPADGYLQVRATSPAVDEKTVAYEVRKFLRAKRGRYIPFLFWHPVAEYQELAACSTISAQSKVIIPWKITGALVGGMPAAAVKGQIDEVRVANITKAFTARHLIPRTGQFCALHFDGSASYVDCGTSATLRVAGDQSIFAWIYVCSDSVSDQNPIISNLTLNASGITLYAIRSTRKLQFFTAQAGAQTSGTSTGTFTLDAWNHVGVVRSGTNITFYINGVAAGTAAGISNPVTSTISFKIGQDQGTLFFCGMIASVRFYDAAVSAGDVALIYADSAPASANLRGRWKLIDGTGTSAADLGSNATPNTGTLSGSAIPVWVSGEEEITFTDGAQTGAVVVTGILRKRLTMRYDSDSISESFMRESPVSPLAIISLPLKQVV